MAPQEHQIFHASKLHLNTLRKLRFNFIWISYAYVKYNLIPLVMGAQRAALAFDQFVLPTFQRSTQMQLDAAWWATAQQ